MDFLTVTFVSLQALGATIGVVSAVWGEIAFARALRDNTIDGAERAHLRHVARGLRFGMFVLLLASLGLVVLAFERHLALQPALQSAYWVEMLLALLIIVISWALSKKRISFALGSAAIFSAWWFLAFLTLGQLPYLSLGAALALYIVATAILFGILWYARMLLATPPASR